MVAAPSRYTTKVVGTSVVGLAGFLVVFFYK